MLESVSFIHIPYMGINTPFRGLLNCEPPQYPPLSLVLINIYIRAKRVLTDKLGEDKVL